MTGARCAPRFPFLKSGCIRDCAWVWYSCASWHDSRPRLASAECLRHVFWGAHTVSHWTWGDKGLHAFPMNLYIKASLLSEANLVLLKGRSPTPRAVHASPPGRPCHKAPPAFLMHCLLLALHPRWEFRRRCRRRSAHRAQSPCRH